MPKTPKTGRCQHCLQARPLTLHEGELEFWGYNPADAAWLCPRDWSRREVAIEGDRPDIHIHRIDPFAEAKGDPDAMEPADSAAENPAA